MDDDGMFATIPDSDAETTPLTDPAIVAGAVDATKVYGSGETAVRALDEVTIGFPAGRFTAIMGPSGSGKSTLMHCLAGLDDLTSGEVYIGDTDLGTLSDKDLTVLRRTRIGFVFQSFNLVPTLTAAENITLPLTLGGKGNQGDQQHIEAVIDTVGLRDRLKHRPSELSGGQQQRVAVARALATKPQIVFADEPTGNLDSRSGGDILAFMRRAVDDFGQTIVMVTHDPVAAAYADSVVFLADGRIVDEMPEPTAEKVLDRLKSLDTHDAHDAHTPDER
jgi:putative ABC transport system ATP-binding protein